jgi:hypothetical protein
MPFRRGLHSPAIQKALSKGFKRQLKLEALSKEPWVDDGSAGLITLGIRISLSSNEMLSGSDRLVLLAADDTGYAV